MVLENLTVQTESRSGSVLDSAYDAKKWLLDLSLKDPTLILKINTKWLYQLFIKYKRIDQL